MDAVDLQIDQYARSCAADRRHDKLLAQVIALRFGRFGLSHCFLLTLLPMPPRLVRGLVCDFQHVCDLWRNFQFTLPIFFPLVHLLALARVLEQSDWRW